MNEKKSNYLKTRKEGRSKRERKMKVRRKRKIEVEKERKKKEENKKEYNSVDSGIVFIQEIFTR